MEPVLTAKVGRNADLFPDVLRLYVPVGSVVADVTYDRGRFWKKVDRSQYRVIASDLVRLRGCALVADFTRLPYKSLSLGALVLDPPYLYTGGFKTLRHMWGRREGYTGTYGCQERAERGIHGVAAVDNLYRQGMLEAWRCLGPRGILIVKCMDQVMSGRQVWASDTYTRMGIEIGFRSEDRFVLVRKGKPTMRHAPENQKHARRNHSYFLVFRKPARRRNGRKEHLERAAEQAEPYR